MHPGPRLAVPIAVVSILAAACGTSSQLPAPTTVPEARWLGISFNDPAAQKVFIYGGHSLSLPTRQLSDMWAWDGKNWTTVPLPAGAEVPTERARGLSTMTLITSASCCSEVSPDAISSIRSGAGRADGGPACPMRRPPRVLTAGRWPMTPIGTSWWS